MKFYILGQLRRGIRYTRYLLSSMFGSRLLESLLLLQLNISAKFLEAMRLLAATASMIACVKSILDSSRICGSSFCGVLD